MAVTLVALSLVLAGCDLVSFGGSQDSNRSQRPALAAFDPCTLITRELVHKHAPEHMGYYADRGMLRGLSIKNERIDQCEIQPYQLTVGIVSAPLPGGPDAVIPKQLAYPAKPVKLAGVGDQGRIVKVPPFTWYVAIEKAGVLALITYSTQGRSVRDIKALAQDVARELPSKGRILAGGEILPAQCGKLDRTAITAILDGKPLLARGNETKHGFSCHYRSRKEIRILVDLYTEPNAAELALAGLTSGDTEIEVLGYRAAAGLDGQDIRVLLDKTHFLRIDTADLDSSPVQQSGADKNRLALVESAIKASGYQPR